MPQTQPLGLWGKSLRKDGVRRRGVYLYLPRGSPLSKKQTKYRRMGRLPLCSGAAGCRTEEILYYLRPDWIEEIVMQSGRKDSPENGVIDFIRIRNVFGGISTIGFKSCDQGREKFQGASLDFVWFDEEPPRDIYEECHMRVIDRRGDIFGTMTPLKGLTFVYEEIFLNRHGDGEVWYEFMEWNDNPYLSGEEIARLENCLDEEQLQSRR